jgi:hypothetical protein
MNPAPRAVPAYQFPDEASIPDAFDVSQFATDTGLDLYEAAELLSAAVADDFI